MNKLFLVCIAFFLAVVFAQPDKRGEVLWPKTQNDCDFQGECFWDIAGVGATCALDIAAGASLTPAMWAMIITCVHEVYTAEKECYPCLEELECDVEKFLCRESCGLPINNEMTCEACEYIC